MDVSSSLASKGTQKPSVASGNALSTTKPHARKVHFSETVTQDKTYSFREYNRRSEYPTKTAIDHAKGLEVNKIKSAVNNELIAYKLYEMEVHEGSKQYTDWDPLSLKLVIPRLLARHEKVRQLRTLAEAEEEAEAPERQQLSPDDDYNERYGSEELEIDLENLSLEFSNEDIVDEELLDDI